MFLASPTIQSRLQLLLRRASPLSRGYSRSPPDLVSSAAQPLAAATAQNAVLGRCRHQTTDRAKD